MSNILELSTTKLSKLIKNGKLSSEELVNESLSHIKNKDPEINSFITILEESSLKNAKKIDEKLSKKEIEHSFITGIPIMLKDNIATKGTKTTAASKFLENYVSPYDAFVTKKIIDKSGIIIGKGNCDEFAMGSSNENSYFGPVKNPWDIKKVPGGSSGGPALVKTANGSKYAVAGIIVGKKGTSAFMVPQEKCEWMLNLLHDDIN